MGSLCPVLQDSFWSLSEERNVSVCFLVTRGGTMPCAFCGCLTVGQSVTSRFWCPSGCQRRLLSLCPAGSTHTLSAALWAERTDTFAVLPADGFRQRLVTSYLWVFIAGKLGVLL